VTSSWVFFSTHMQRWTDRHTSRKYVLHFSLKLCFQIFSSDEICVFFFLRWNFANFLRGTRRNVRALFAKWSLFLSDFNQKMDWISKFQVMVSSISFHENPFWTVTRSQTDGRCYFIYLQNGRESNEKQSITTVCWTIEGVLVAGSFYTPGPANIRQLHRPL